ncbi:hypothetical protein CDO73_08690 [Saccharibacillus sp. O23]|nr:hypothetical protein CDO73_08690 [Saccharibacillus sp. O23]
MPGFLGGLFFCGNPSIEVPEDETPSNGLLPKTGEESRTPIYMLGMAVIALGAGLLRRAARQ